jgi:Uma2 family endonuclease
LDFRLGERGDAIVAWRRLDWRDRIEADKHFLDFSRLTMATVTHTIGQTARAEAAVPTELIWRLTVAQYHRMVHDGILTEDDPVELLAGWLIPKMPKSPPHRAATRALRVALESLVPAGWYVDSQEPITTADSEPEPDALVVRGESRDYVDRHPGPAEVALVVEVSDTTLQRDRALKRQLYAAAGIANYWIVNLVERRVEVHTGPSGPSPRPDYAHLQSFGPTETIPLSIDNQPIGNLAVADLLP